ncbi:hypothetical protein SFRURICE_018847 [Spodoptera frugiperda]|nr:hypothetical protein SFRURICE_018847 [Spodoptera frugiperda]
MKPQTENWGAFTFHSPSLINIITGNTVIRYTYNNTKLEQVNEFTLLGITIDTHVNWKNRLNLPTSNLKIHSSGPLIMSIKIYNNLPRMLKDETKTSVFLNKLKTFLHSKCYYSIKEFMDDKTIKK